jgi:hypothetical protein
VSVHERIASVLYCLKKNKSRKIKVHVGKIWVAHSIELWCMKLIESIHEFIHFMSLTFSNLLLYLISTGKEFYLQLYS